jgi:hypothetical protein
MEAILEPSVTGARRRTSLKVQLDVDGITSSAVGFVGFETEENNGNDNNDNGPVQEMWNVEQTRPDKQQDAERNPAQRQS